jgi:hypothetical protein
LTICYASRHIRLTDVGLKFVLMGFFGICSWRYGLVHSFWSHYIPNQ